MASPSETTPVGCLFMGAESAIKAGFVPASGVLILVSLDEANSHVGVTGNPAIAWYHLTRNLIEGGTHPSELLWGVVLAFEDVKNCRGWDPDGEEEDE